MECRKFQITLISAQDLENVREKIRMKVYTKLSFVGDSQTERTSPVDTEGETNPAWNFTTGYTIGKKAVEYQGIMLVIKLYCSRTLGDRYIGEVSVSFKDLFDGAVATGGSATVSYPVKKGAADSKGVLKFSYSFGDIVIVKKPSVWARGMAVAGTILVKVIAEVAFGGGLDDLDIPFSGEDVPIDVDVPVDSSGSSQDPKN